jgi:hypothetical protein
MHNRPNATLNFPFVFGCKLDLYLVGLFLRTRTLRRYHDIFVPNLLHNRRGARLERWCYSSLAGRSYLNAKRIGGLDCLFGLGFRRVFAIGERDLEPGDLTACFGSILSRLHDGLKDRAARTAETEHTVESGLQLLRIARRSSEVLESPREGVHGNAHAVAKTVEQGLLKPEGLSRFSSITLRLTSKSKITSSGSLALATRSSWTFEERQLLRFAVLRVAEYLRAADWSTY